MVALLAAPLLLRLPLGALAHVEDSRALGAVELVPGQREQVHAQGVYVEREDAARLHRVSVDEHAALVGNAGNVADGLDRADFVVGVHDRDEDSLRPDGRCDGAGVYLPVPVYG